MTSERKTGDRQSSRALPREAYVWIWLPGSTEPVVAGRLARDGDLHVFNYGRSYLERPDAIPIYLPELPLQRGALVPQQGAAWGTYATVSALLAVVWLTVGVTTGGLAWVPWFLLIIIPWGLAIARRPKP